MNQALNAFRQATLANSNHAESYYGAGLVFIQLKQYEEARKVIEYARDLYQKTGNTQWSNNANQLLAEIQKLNKP